MRGDSLHGIWNRGNNYFKLRDIGRALDFSVEWDGANNAIIIDTTKGHTSRRHVISVGIYAGALAVLPMPIWRKLHEDKQVNTRTWVDSGLPALG